MSTGTLSLLPFYLPHVHPLAGARLRADGPALFSLSPPFLALWVRRHLAVLTRASPDLAIAGNGQRAARQRRRSAIAVGEPRSGDPPLHIHPYLTRFGVGSTLVPSVSPGNLAVGECAPVSAAPASAWPTGGVVDPRGPARQRPGSGPGAQHRVHPTISSAEV